MTVLVRYEQIFYKGCDGTAAHPPLQRISSLLHRSSRLYNKETLLSLIWIPITTIRKNILNSITQCLFRGQLFSPFHSAGCGCAFTCITEFRITGSFLILFIAPVIPAFRADMATKFAIEESSRSIRTPWTPQIYFGHSGCSRQLTIFEHITEFYIFRSRCGRNV